MSLRNNKQQPSRIVSILSKFLGIGNSPEGKLDKATVPTSASNKELLKLLSEADSLIQAERINDAETLYSLLAMKFPNHYSGFVGLAKVASHRQDWPLAIERWRGCREKFPNEPMPVPGWWRAAEAHAQLQLGQLDKAETLYQSVVEELPLNVPAFEGLARVATKRHDWDIALKRWEDCIQSFPDHPNIQIWRNEVNSIKEAQLNR